MPAPAGAAAVRIAVIIPAWNQPGLLPEAIASALAQEAAPPFALVVVDDGCPAPETAATALHLAAAHPGRIFLLRQRNQGLSVARNAGIDFALAAFPACEALFFLDADNRLRPGFLARAFAALRAAPASIGWFYPDIDSFGMGEGCACGGEFSLLQLLVQNYCEAGSLVRRAVFERGLRFDTTAMRAGFEDWDFWLQAARAGFRGEHLPGAGFLYRRRPESMLAAAERQREHLLRLLRERHAPLLRPRHLMTLEAEEAPRFALFAADAAEVDLFLDPAHPAPVAPAAIRHRLRQAAAAPGAVHAPAIALFAAAGAVPRLRALGLLPMLLWWVERLLREHEAVTLELVAATGTELALEQPQEAASGIAGAALLALGTERLWQLAEDPLSPGLASLEASGLDGSRSALRIARLRLRLPGGAPQAGPAALRRLQAELAALAALRTAAGMPPRPWRTDWRGPRSGMAAAARAGLGLGATLPLLPDADRRDIAFLLPVFAFAGLEKVVLRQAAVLRARGWRTHLVIAGAMRMEWAPEIAASFDTVSLFQGLGEDRLAHDEGYFGGTVSRMAEHPGARDALGLLAQCHVVVNTHAVGCHALAAPLRALGVRVFGALHLVERTPWDEPHGNPHMLAAYEHAYDGVLVISEALRRWCLAHAVPAQKLILVPNAPGYASTPARRQAALAARPGREGRLRALFLGRLDAQKGIDRLAAIIAATDPAAEGPDGGPDGVPNIAWRVVGRPVLGDAAPHGAPGGAQPLLAVAPEPPVQAPAALDDLYAWADLLVLPSRFEGVPLVILEAQRMGCVVLATDVGAVAEIVTDGEDGILIPADLPEEAIIARFIAAIRSLEADRTGLRTLGARAAARAGALDWEANLRAFMARLDALVPPPVPDAAPRGARQPAAVA